MTEPDAQTPDNDRARPWHLALVIVLVAALGGVIFWAVGGGGSGSEPAALPLSPSSSASAGASPKASPVPSNDGYDFEKRQADTAAAKKINLTLADMPTGWAADSSDDDSADSEQFDKQLGACLGDPTVNDADRVSVDSPDFSYATLHIQSSVDFAHTVEQARHDLDIAKSPKSLDCLKQALADNADQLAPGASIASTDVQPISEPDMGDGSFGLRVVVKLATPQGDVPVYVDILGFLAGRAEVSGIFTNVAIPVPPAIEQQMMSVMVGRATGASTSSNNA